MLQQTLTRSDSISLLLIRILPLLWWSDRQKRVSCSSSVALVSYIAKDQAGFIILKHVALFVYSSSQRLTLISSPEKTCSKLADGLNFYDLKKKLTPEVALTLPWGYIHVYYHSSQTSLFVYISEERLVLWFLSKN